MATIAELEKELEDVQESIQVFIADVFHADELRETVERHVKLFEDWIAERAVR